MATADQYARWIVANQAKKGTPEFETVAAAYKEARGETPAAVQPAPTSEPKESSIIDDVLKRTIGGRIKSGNLLYPDEESFVRKTLQGAASGPVSGVVQKVAQLTGNKEVSDKIAQTAKEGNFVGGLLQPEGWLTGSKAADFINKGRNVVTQALRSGATVAPLAALSASENPSDSAIADTAQQGASGMAVGTALPLLLRTAGKVAKPVYNILEPYLPSFGTGSTGAQKSGARLAGKVAEGEGQRDEITNLLLAAKNGQTASDAALPAKNAEFSALQELVSQTRPTVKRAVETAKDEAARAEIANISGTPEMMQRVIERRASRTEPMRQTAMGAASVADTKGAQLADEVLKKRQSEISALQNQGRMATESAQQGVLATGERAADGQLIRNLPEGNFPRDPSIVQPTGLPSGAYPVPGQPRVPPRYAQNVGPEEQFAAAANEMGQVAGQRKQEGAFKQMQLDSIKDYGMKPLDVGAIQSAISSKMKAPGGGIGIDAKVLQGVGDEIARIKELKGRVFPEDLHEIRKKGINDVIESLNKGVPGSTDKRAAQVAGELRNKIDQVLDEASGGSWTPYLKSFQRLSRMKDAMETGQGLKDALTGRFGNERITPFGTALRSAEDKMLPESGRTAMDALYPKQRSAVERVASQFEKERQIGELAKAGSTEALRVMRATELPGTAPGMISWKITALNKVLNALEGTGGLKTNKALAELMLKDPQTLGRLMADKTKPAIDPVVRAILERQASLAGASSLGSNDK